MCRNDTIKNSKSMKTTVKTHVEVVTDDASTTKKAFEDVAPKEDGKLDMVIAFDTTGSMSAYIDAVRKEVADLIPKLFKDNPELRLGIVAFGDYCDMRNAKDFGIAYQCIMPTDNENELIRFIKESKDTSGGDGDEFYELVIKKIVEETPWREGSSRSILLIADAEPHGLGYSYENIIKGNQIDWREEARNQRHQCSFQNRVQDRPSDGGCNLCQGFLEGPGNLRQNGSRMPG